MLQHCGCWLQTHHLHRGLCEESFCELYRATASAAAAAPPGEPLPARAAARSPSRCAAPPPRWPAHSPPAWVAASGATSGHPHSRTSSSCNSCWRACLLVFGTAMKARVCRQGSTSEDRHSVPGEAAEAGEDGRVRVAGDGQHLKAGHRRHGRRQRHPVLRARGRLANIQLRQRRQLADGRGQLQPQK